MRREFAFRIRLVTSAAADFGRFLTAGSVVELARR